MSSEVSQQTQLDLSPDNESFAGATSYMDTFLPSYEEDETTEITSSSPEEITQNFTGRKRVTPDAELLSSAHSLSQIEILAKLNLSAEQRILYRSLLSHEMRHRFALCKEQVQIKDERLVTSLKREHAKTQNLRTKVKFMKLLQRKRDECVREIFQLAKRHNMTLQELHRVYAAAMYLYGEDQHWFDQIKSLNEQPESGEGSVSLQEHDPTPRFNLNLNTHKDAEDFLQKLAVSPLVERIRTEKLWLEQQLSAMSTDPRFEPGQDPAKRFSLVKKQAADDFIDVIQEISQQLKVSNNMLFEELEFKGPDTQNTATQTTWKPFSGRDVLLSEDLIDELIWEENQNKLAVDRQKQSELSSVLNEAQQGLKYATAKIKRYKKTLTKETTEVNIIESNFQNKLKAYTDEIEKLKHDIVYMKESSHFMTPEMMDKKRKIERKIATLEDERHRDKQAHQLVSSRYERSLITLTQRIEEYEKLSTLHEMKIKSLNHRLRFYEDNSQKTVISKKKAPRGRIALMFTDIESSTSAWEKNPEEMEKALMLHNKIIRYLLQKTDGFEVKTEGDAFMCAFPSVTSAVECALAIQMKLHQAKWSPELLKMEETCVLDDDLGRVMFRGLRVRIGIGVGEPLIRVDPTTGREDYFGPVVNKAARVESFAKGGQIAISQEIFDEIEPRLHKLTYKVWYKRLGEQKLKGITGDHGIVHILPEVLSHRRWQNLSPVERAMNKLQLENKSMRTKIAEQEDKVKQIQAQLTYRETIIDELEQNIQELHNTIQKHKIAVKQAEAHLEESQVELERRQIMIEYRTMELQRLEQSSETVSRENSTLKQVIYVLKRDIDSCERHHKDVLLDTFGGIDFSSLADGAAVRQRSNSVDYSRGQDAMSSRGTTTFVDSRRSSISIVSLNGANTARLSDYTDDEDSQDDVRSVVSDASFIEHLCSSSRSHSTVHIGPGGGAEHELSRRPNSKHAKQQSRNPPKLSIDIVPNIEDFTENALLSAPFTPVGPRPKGSQDDPVFLTSKSSMLYSDATSSDMIAPQNALTPSFASTQRFQSPLSLLTQSSSIQRPGAFTGGAQSTVADRAAKEIESLKRQLDFTRSQRDYYRQKAKNILLKRGGTEASHFPNPVRSPSPMILEEHPTRSHALEKVTMPSSSSLPSFTTSKSKKKLNRLSGIMSSSFSLHSTPKRLLKCVEDTVSTSDLRKSLSRARSKSSAVSTSLRSRTPLYQVNPMDSFEPQTPPGVMTLPRREISTAGDAVNLSEDKSMKMHYAFY